MKNKLLKLSIIPLTVLLLTACAQGSGKQTFAEDTTSVMPADAHTCCPLSTPDMGKEYIDSIIFFGESTTAHMKSRGVLSGGKKTTQVWAPKSGTVNLDMQCESVKIVYPETGELLTVGQAAEKKQPSIMVLTFGLNGAVTKIKQGEDYFSECYLKLINGIRTASPSTKIMLQSCYPIAIGMDMNNYTVDVATLKQYIETINSWTHALAKAEGLWYLDTYTELIGNDGYLSPEFDSGDGYHLTAEAYIKVLEYIRTHGIKE